MRFSIITLFAGASALHVARSQSSDNNLLSGRQLEPHSPIDGDDGVDGRILHDGGSSVNAANVTSIANGASSLHADYMVAVVCIAGLLW